MCRFLLYQGPPLVLSTLLTEPRYSLIRQSYRARERAEPLNGDGFGIAWYAPDISPSPGLFRSITPAWNNDNLWRLAQVIRSPCLLAHVRAATGLHAVNERNCHPFAHGALSFMHNGDVGGFHEIRRPLLAELSDETFDVIQGTTDTEHVFALLLERLRSHPSPPSLDDLAEALRWTIRRLLELGRQHARGAPCSLNLALSDGRVSVVTRFTSHPDAEPESLHLHTGKRYVCEGGTCRMVHPGEEGGAVIVSSEPLSGDPGWESVPRNHLLTITERHEVTATALELA